MERLNIVGYPFSHGAFECCFYLKHFGSISVYVYYQHFRIKSYKVGRGVKNSQKLVDVNCERSIE